MRSSSRPIESLSKPPIIVPVAPVRGLIAPDIDRILSDLARSADPLEPDLRNALFTAYAPRLHRILRRYWYRNLQTFGCELDDLEQELFLIFDQLLQTWSGNGSFSAYLHGATPWRLFDAARRLAPHEHPLVEQPVSISNEDDALATPDARVLFEELAETLSPFDKNLLERHVRDGESLTVIAKSIGSSARTVRRAWLRLQQHLKRALTNR